MDAQVLTAGAAVCVTVIVSVVTAVWVLSGKLSQLQQNMSQEISSLRLELAETKQHLAVMEERERQRSEKTDQMWGWWLKTIEGGWIAQMKSIAASAK